MVRPRRSGEGLVWKRPTGESISRRWPVVPRTWRLRVRMDSHGKHCGYPARQARCGTKEVGSAQETPQGRYRGESAVTPRLETPTFAKRLALRITPGTRRLPAQLAETPLGSRAELPRGGMGTSPNCRARQVIAQVHTKTLTVP